MQPTHIKVVRFQQGYAHRPPSDTKAANAKDYSWVEDVLESVRNPELAELLVVFDRPIAEVVDMIEKIKHAPMQDPSTRKIIETYMEKHMHNLATPDFRDDAMSIWVDVVAAFEDWFTWEQEEREEWKQL